MHSTFRIDDLNFSIRPSSLADTENVTDLLQISYSTLMTQSYSPDVLRVALPAMTTANPMLLKSGSYFVVTDDSNTSVIISCGGWTKYAPGTNEEALTDDNKGHIRHFATHPAWLGKGIARRIIDRCVEEASACGISALQCYSSLNAEEFYKSCDFVPIEKWEVPMGVISFPCVLMERKLSRH